jgi:pyruvate,orthophosphate dikinase
MHVELKAKTRQETSGSAAQTLRKPEKTKAPDMAKWVYTFGDGAAEGAADKRDLLGGKGANLAEMANLGLPVPPGFTISTELCTYFYANNKN